MNAWITGRALEPGPRLAWGITSWVSGMVLLVGGLALSVTLVGACVGVPMAVAGLPMLIAGLTWMITSRTDAAQQVLAAGIKAGLQDARAADQPIDHGEAFRIAAGDDAGREAEPDMVDDSESVGSTGGEHVSQEASRLGRVEP